MLSQTLNLIATSFLIGFVGYGTNWLAIKMLFRPHKRSVLSFGWQGVIPKNRAKLAREIGTLVGDKLLRKEDIRKAFFNASVQNRLENAVEHELRVFLEKDFGTIESILEKSGYKPKTLITLFLSSVNSTGLIDDIVKKTAENAVEKLLKINLGRLSEHKNDLTRVIEMLLSSKNLHEETGSAISSYINNFVMSGKSLGDIIPQSLQDKIPELSAFITERILVSLENSLDDEKTRAKIASKLTDIKNNHFSDGTFDQIKLGFLNVFMNEDSLKDIVDKYLPTLVKSIKNSDEVRAKINASVSEYISSVVNKPLYMHAGSIGFENIYSLKSSIVTAVQQSMGSETVADKISGKLISFAEKNPERTLGDILEQAGMKEKLTATINSNAKIDIASAASLLADASSRIPVSNLYSYIPKKMFQKIKTSLIKEINLIIDKNIDKIVTSVDFPSITEQRINSLNLYEVEKLLFSFMSDSFKWINILGFVLGFALGAVQSILIYVLS